MARPLKPELDVYDALANPLRRRIVERLRKGDMAATELVDEFGITQPALSRHLQVMRRARLVQQRSAGQRRIYRLNTAALKPALRWIGRQVE